MQYPVVEIFKSRQGEGFNTGKEMVFLRLGGCNLSCAWCDTAYNDYAMLEMPEIKRRVDALGIKSLLVTGGEPLIVEGLNNLLEQFKVDHYWLAVETNGLEVAEREVLKKFDYITVSPKAEYRELYHKEFAVSEAHELRVIVTGDVLEFCRFVAERITAQRCYLSPCERDGVINLEETIHLLALLNQDDPRWLLSLQTHKLCGMK